MPPIIPLTHEEYQRTVQDTLVPLLDYKIKWGKLRQQITARHVQFMDDLNTIGRGDLYIEGLIRGRITETIEILAIMDKMEE